MGAIGLGERDLFHPSKGPAAIGRHGRSTFRGRPSGIFESLEHLVEAVALPDGAAPVVWIYRSENGQDVGAVVRVDVADGTKRITPAVREAFGWRIAAMPKPRPLYRLPELAGTRLDDIVFVVEGEKCVEAIRALGLVGTTSAGGAKASATADWSPLRGRQVVILPDRDEPGLRYATDVARAARRAGVASVRIVRLADRWPDLPDGGDFADLMEMAHGNELKLRAELLRLLEQTSEFDSTAEPVEAARMDEPYIPFPLEALPIGLAEFVTATAEAIGCDPSLISCPLLATVAAAIGNVARIELKAGWCEPALLWIVAVAESGSCKSPAFDAVLGPLRSVEAERHAEYVEAMKSYRHEERAYRMRLKASRADGVDGAAPPIPPIRKRRIVSDVTTESLAQILSENPDGVLLHRDEFAGFLGSFDRYAGGGRGGSDTAFWLSAFNAAPCTVDRKTGEQRCIHVPNAWVSLLGTIQPEPFGRMLGSQHRENGLLARILAFAPPRTTRRWSEKVVPEPVRNSWSRCIRRLMSLASPSGSDWAPLVLPLGREAKRLWVEFFNEHNAEADRQTGLQASIWSKHEALAARIALGLALARWALGSDACPPSEIDADSMRGAVRIVRWFGVEMLRLVDRLDETDDERRIRRLYDWIRRRGDLTTVREVVRSIREYRDQWQLAEADLDALESSGRGRWVEVPPGELGGRPTREFRTTMPALVDETPVDETSRHVSRRPAATKGAGPELPQRGVGPEGESPSSPDSVGRLAVDETLRRDVGEAGFVDTWRAGEARGKV